MEFSHTIKINANSEKIFNIYKDVNSWSLWDYDVEYSSIQGDFKTGAIGVLKPKNAPKSKLYFTEVIQNKTFTTMGKLPLCKIYFKHNIDKINENSVKVTHTILFKGLLSPLFSKIIGKNIKESLPKVLHNLKEKAESNIWDK